MQIISYQPQYAKYFEQLNKEWLLKHFYIEPIDEYVLTHPQEAILDKGGRILFAEYKGDIIGTIALLPINSSEIEFIKMGVNENYQGLGAGKLLFAAAIQTAKEMGMKKVILYSNKGLSPALAIYRKHGFVEVPVEEHVHYERCDIKMELVF